MILHYLKIILRNLQKYRAQSLIAIVGLAFGVACFVPALYWLRYETGYDGFYPDAGRIYRIYSVEKQTGKVNLSVPGILEKKLHEHFPVTAVSTVIIIRNENYRTDDVPHIRLNTLYTDSAFLNVFEQTFLCGDFRQPLQDLRHIILTETVAKRLFGDIENAIGKQVKSTTFRFPPYTVTAVVKDPPPNTNLPFDAIHFPEIQNQMTEYMPEESQWTYFNKQMYVKFHPRTDMKAIAGQLRDFISELGVNKNLELKLLPISDVRHRIDTGLPFTLDFIRLFVVACLLLLFSAFFNYLNLYIGLFRQRFRELRQRAVNGANNLQLLKQLAFELLSNALLAVALAWCFVVLAQPAFSALLDISMTTSQLMTLFIVCGIGVLAILLLAGVIPLWRMSRSASCYQVNEIPNRPSASRRIAVSLQLAISVVFVISTLVVMMQLRYVNRKDLGFDHHGVIQLQLADPQSALGEPLKVLKSKINSIPQIVGITETPFEPQYESELITEIEWEGKSLHARPSFQLIETDASFADIFKLKITHGKWWDTNDRQKIVLNEEAVRVMGLNNPIGAIISMYPGLISSVGNRQKIEYEVVGVVSDFHSLSLRSPIYPAIFTESAWRSHILYIRIIPGQEQNVMKQIAAFLPETHVTLANARLTTLDALYDRLNHSEQTGLKLFTLLAIVCLLVSLFGIYAVAMASTQRRRKEIAVRKVSGAEAFDIVRMFLREYIGLVLIAGIIALPVAYFLMNRWLQSYAYHTVIPWWLLIAVIAGLTAIVLMTVLRRVLKAANQNPANVINEM